VTLNVADASFRIFIADEYGDYDEDHQLLCFFLVLNSLMDYHESEDYLEWCRHNHLDVASTYWLDYYKELSGTVITLERTLGTIDTGIPSLDYQLRAGAFHALVSLRRS
jgi:hypothetical protein